MLGWNRPILTPILLKIPENLPVGTGLMGNLHKFFILYLVLHRNGRYYQKKQMITGLCGYERGRDQLYPLSTGSDMVGTLQI